MKITSTKPYKGAIKDWTTRVYPDPTLGSVEIVFGEFVDHPQFAGRRGHTSIVVKWKQNGWFETLNSRYRLVGPRKVNNG